MLGSDTTRTIEAIKIFHRLRLNSKEYITLYRGSPWVIVTMKWRIEAAIYYTQYQMYFEPFKKVERLAISSTPAVLSYCTTLEKDLNAESYKFGVLGKRLNS